MYIIPSVEDLPPIQRGRPYSFEFYLEDEDGARIDLTNYILKAQIRNKFDINGAFVAEFTINITDIINGELELALDKEITASLKGDRGYYDLLVIDDTGEENSYLRGTVELWGAVTRNPYIFAPTYAQDVHMTDIVEAEVV